MGAKRAKTREPAVKVIRYTGRHPLPKWMGLSGLPPPSKDGPPKRRRRALRGVDVYGLSQSVTLSVGLNKGEKAFNRTDRCASAPDRFGSRALDDLFRRLRASQVGADHVEGFRAAAGRGWYRGASERSTEIRVAYVPPAGGGPAGEPTFMHFKRHMLQLAQSMAKALCQDSVLVADDTGTRRSVSAVCWRPKRGPCSR